MFDTYIVHKSKSGEVLGEAKISETSSMGDGRMMTSLDSTKIASGMVDAYVAARGGEVSKSDLLGFPFWLSCLVDHLSRARSGMIADDECLKSWRDRRPQVLPEE